MTKRDKNRSQKVYSYFNVKAPYQEVDVGLIGPPGEVGLMGASGSMGYGQSYNVVTNINDNTYFNTTYDDLGASENHPLHPLTPRPQLTLTTGDSILLFLQAEISIITQPPGNSYISVAVSGSSTIAASDAHAITNYHDGNGQYYTLNGFVKLTGLTPGVNTFTMKYRVSAGGVWVWNKRSITAFQ